MKNKLYLIAIVSVLTISSIACGKEKAAPAIEGTPVAEEPALEEEETVETTTTPTTEEEPAEITEPTVSDNEVEETTDESEEDDGLAEVDGEVVYEDGFKVKAGDYIVTDKELTELPEKEWAQIQRTYQFLCRMDSSLPVEASNNTIGTIYMRYENEELLNLLNEDFAKAYDIIEECGITVTNDEGKELVPTEMRTTITDFDSFHDAYMDIISYSGDLSSYSGDCKIAFDRAIEKEDVDTAQKMYNDWIKAGEYSLKFDEFIDFYQMAYTRSEK